MVAEGGREHAGEAHGKGLKFRAGFGLGADQAVTCESKKRGGGIYKAWCSYWSQGARIGFDRCLPVLCSWITFRWPREYARLVPELRCLLRLLSLGFGTSPMLGTLITDTLLCPVEALLAAPCRLDRPAGAHTARSFRSHSAEQVPARALHFGLRPVPPALRRSHSLPISPGWIADEADWRRIYASETVLLA